MKTLWELNDEAELAFKTQYMTTSDVIDYMGVTRTALFIARKDGRIPYGINIEGRTTVWPREFIMPYLEAWRAVRDAKAQQEAIRYGVAPSLQPNAA